MASYYIMLYYTIYYTLSYIILYCIIPYYIILLYRYYTVVRKVHEITQHDTTSCCIYKDNLLCCHLQLVTTKLD